MARARNIKPGFFTNEQLVECSMETRLLFIGMWTIADRDGRLEDRPKRIKMQLFPADNVDVDACLEQLSELGFIERYEAGGQRYIQVVNWGKHQNPHIKEAPSTIPAPDSHDASTEQAPYEPPLIPSSLIPDSSSTTVERQRARPRVRAVPKPKRSPKQIEYDEVTQAIGVAWRPGKAWDELTATEQQTCARCSAELHDVRGSPEQVAAAKAAWDASPKWRDLTFTPDALKKHWGELIALSSQNGTANHATNRERAQDIGALKRAAFAGGHGESTDTEHATGRARAAS